MSVRLSLDRDFTRFLRDPTFPHKVTVCIGEVQLYCSGAVIAQQSSVLERKLREDNGVLLFEEFVDVDGSCSSILKCIEYLHGADLEFNVETLAVVIKFASLYEVEDLFEQALIWLANHLNTFKSVRNAIHYLTIANTLSETYCSRIEKKLKEFIQLNCLLFQKDYGDILEMGITGPVMMFLIAEIPASIGNLLKGWIAVSNEHKDFIITNHSGLPFPIVFPFVKEFTSFVESLSSGALSNDSVRALLELQRSYFISQEICGGCHNASSSAPQVHSSDTDKSVSELPPKKSSSLFQQLKKLQLQLRNNQILIWNMPLHADLNKLKEIICVNSLQVHSGYLALGAQGYKYGVITFRIPKMAFHFWRRNLKRRFDYDGYRLKILCHLDLSKEIKDDSEGKSKRPRL